MCNKRSRLRTGLDTGCLSCSTQSLIGVDIESITIEVQVIQLEGYIQSELKQVVFSIFGSCL